MTEDTPDDDFDGSNTLRVPFVFVKRGDPLPTEWMARHPGWVKFPATLVPRDPAPVDTITPGQAYSRPAEADPDSVPIGMERPVAAGAPTSVGRFGRRTGGRPPQYPRGFGAEPGAVGNEDPVAVYLRMSKTLDRMVRGGLWGSGRTKQSRASTIAAPLLEADAPAQKASVQSVRDPKDKSADPTAPVPFLDDQGRPVISPRGEPVLRPAGLDPHFFVRQGLEDKKIEQELLREAGNDGGAATMEYIYKQLANFRQFGPWDAQRIGGEKRPEYVDYSTIEIGLYAAAAGFSRAQILEIQNIHAARKSNFHKDTEYDKTYPFLPKRNIANTEIGFQLYESGRISVDGK